MKDPARVEEEFKWARTAPEAKLVNKMESDFLERVKMVKKQALRAKETMKQKKKQNTLKLLDQCKTHGGPVTTTS